MSQVNVTQNSLVRNKSGVFSANLKLMYECSIFSWQKVNLERFQIGNKENQFQIFSWVTTRKFISVDWSSYTWRIFSVVGNSWKSLIYRLTAGRGQKCYSPIFPLCHQQINLVYQDWIQHYTHYSTLHTFSDQRLLLVVKDDVGQPDDLGGDVDLPNPPVLAGVPPELVVVPLLHKTRIKPCREGGSFIKRHYSHVIRILSYIIHWYNIMPIRKKNNKDGNDFLSHQSHPSSGRRPMNVNPIILILSPPHNSPISPLTVSTQRLVVRIWFFKS